MVIFDCNGVLVDSESIANGVLSRALASVGIKAPPQALARRFSGRRPSDIFHAIEHTTGRRLPKNFDERVSDEIVRRLRTALRPVPYVTRALRDIMHRIWRSLLITKCAAFAVHQLNLFFTSSMPIASRSSATLPLATVERIFSAATTAASAAAERTSASA